MDDLAGKLNEILNNPAEMAKFQQLANNLLGQNGTAAQSAPAPQQQAGTPDLSALAGLLGQQSAPQPSVGGLSPELLGTVARLAPLFSSVQQEDNSTRLLHALRPLLKGERQKKLDEAMKIMRMLKFLPLLKEQGILQGIL